MWMVVIASLILLIIVYYFFIKSSKFKEKDDTDVYKRKDFLLTKTEKVAFDKLNECLNKSNLTVIPKMRLTDFIWTPKENRNAYLKIQMKFVDFLILKTPQLHPVAAIFITNPENKAKMQSLEIIEPVLEKAQIKLIKVSPQEIFSGTLQDKLKQMVWEGL
ncbi:DUF2726 domain-containing protein [Hippea maritima]|uniref:DUF2726 domain-containing protein n=1 Tax=Hippea maritima (strain ATCC 700847 / DSM 10411 / MH2) TaxID=760142 RepID=F2LXJ7_HIPMA|nr:DUF2726 domain-containing protein [Hippea maritima]AEA33183.1 hypothetical protein Hipma_0206 [Hippea maritima DSM 10411]